MNVVVIVLDCLRLDYSNEIWKILSKYGFHKMDFAITTAPWTIPAHASMLTGLYPSEHGAHETKTREVGNIEFRIRDNLVNDLKRRGYTTYLLTANAFLTERFGFKDFDHIYFVSTIPDKITLKPEELRYLTEKTLARNPLNVAIDVLKDGKFKILLKGLVVFMYRKISSVIGGWPKEKGISKIIKLVKKINFREPFFIFMNIMELHEPYKSNNIRYGYERQLDYLSNKFRNLIETMESKGLLDGLVIITSDHGQLLGEKGKSGHGVYLDDELLKVPFFIKLPVLTLNLNTGNKYISHTNIRKFIMQFIDTKQVDVDALLSEAAFAESFTSYHTFKCESHRIAVYFQGYKGIYNVNKGEFEDTICPEKLAPAINTFLKRIQIKKKEVEKKVLKRKIKQLKKF